MLGAGYHRPVSLSLHDYLLLARQVLLDISPEAREKRVQTHLSLVALQGVRVLTSVMFQSHERL